MNDNHQSRSHSRFAPSAAKRWMNCPGSVRLSEAVGAPDVASVYAAEGTVAHGLLESVLRGERELSQLHREVGHVETVDGHDITIDADMVEHVKNAAGKIAWFAAKHEASSQFVEATLDLSFIHPAMYGHADCILQAHDRLVVIDFKYGQGVQVDAIDNKQGLTYAVGAVNFTGFEGDVIDIVIIQPRGYHPDGPVRRATYDWLEVMGHAADIYRAAELADSDDAPFKAGDWCRWCPANASCSTYARWCFEAADVPPLGDENAMTNAPSEPESLSPEKLAQALDRTGDLEHWIKAVRAEAMHRIENGQSIPGWKRVEGRATRKWLKDDNDTLAELVRRTNRPPEDFQDIKVMSVAKAEKVVGKKAFADRFDDLFEKSSSGYTLAPETDPRPDVVDDARAYFANADPLS